jgi:diguanylate cyclase (GGDEF)-like protein
MGFASFAVMFMALMRILSANLLVGTIDVFFSLLSLLFLVQMRRYKDKIELFSYLMLGITLMLFTGVFLFAPEQSVRIILFFLFVTAAFFLKGKKIGCYSLILVFTIISATYFSGIVETHYSKLDIVAVYLYLVVLYFIISAYEAVKNMQFAKIVELNENLEILVRRRTEQLQEVNNQLKEEKRALKIISMTDKLTGLHNRIKLEETFEYEKRQAKRYKTELSIVMMDLDYFKAVNDTYGHNAGDIFLKAIAMSLKKIFRETDVIGRWGGEEFLVLLPKTDIKDAYVIVERLRKQIEDENFETIGKKTASFGVTKLHEDDTLDVAIGRADRALYYAKENGRNQVTLAS